VDFVLNLAATSSRLPSRYDPLERPGIYLNDFFPPHIHHVWTSSPFLWSFSISPRRSLNISAPRRSSIPVSPPSRICANQVYARVIRQPIGFFQHHPTGGSISTVINDVERVRYA